MPSALNNQHFPVQYEPWKVVRAAVKDENFDKYDLLIWNATNNNYERAVTNEQVLISDGYVFAAEQKKSGDGISEIQVILPGSVVPFVAGALLEPGSSVILEYNSSDGQKAIPNTVAKAAAGKTLGRFIGLYTNHVELREAADNDVILLWSGVQ